MSVNELTEIQFWAYDSKSNASRNVKIDIPKDWVVDYSPLDESKFLQETKPKSRESFDSHPPICYKGTKSTAKLQYTSDGSATLLICNKRFKLERRSAFKYSVIVPKKAMVRDSIEKTSFEIADGRVRKEREKYEKLFDCPIALTSEFLEDEGGDDDKMKNFSFNDDEEKERLLKIKNGGESDED